MRQEIGNLSWTSFVSSSNWFQKWAKWKWKGTLETNKIMIIIFCELNMKLWDGESTSVHGSKLSPLGDYIPSFARRPCRRSREEVAAVRCKPPGQSQIAGEQRQGTIGSVLLQGERRPMFFVGWARFGSWSGCDPFFFKGAFLSFQIKMMKFSPPQIDFAEKDIPKEFENLKF